MTKVLLIGGGGREHAIAAALSRDGASLHVIMKNRNPGIARLAHAVLTGSESDPASVTSAAKGWGIDFAVIGPEAPLGAGVSDALRAAGIGVVGPSKAAAQVELSKSFLRSLLDRHKVPGQIRHWLFTDGDEAARFLKDYDRPVAVKPLGLTGGKGVRVSGDHFRTTGGAIAYARSVIAEGIGGSPAVLIEEKLEGEEFTVQVLTDGMTLLPTPAVQDHKRAFEGDRGPNTGGMGSYSGEDHLLPFLRKDEYGSAVQILQRIVDSLRSEGTPYRGVLYGQFMLTADGPKVIETNARFGDPEAMNVLSIMEGPIVETFGQVAHGGLRSDGVVFARKATVCKYLVPNGYGEKPAAGVPVEVDEAAAKKARVLLYYAAVDEAKGGALLTTTSRTVGVVGVGATIREAEQRAEAGLLTVRGDLSARHDIGTAAAIRRRVEHMTRIRSARPDSRSS